MKVGWLNTFSQLHTQLNTTEVNKQQAIIIAITLTSQVNVKSGLNVRVTHKPKIFLAKTT